MNLLNIADVVFDACGQFFQRIGVVSDSTPLYSFSVQVHYYEVMLGSRPTIIIMKSFPYQVIIKVTDEAFVSGISMKALSLQTGDSVSAVCECQEAASCPYRPSKGRKSRALPHLGPRALQPLRSGYKAVNLIKRIIPI
jgi:hypothetical protein